MVYYIQSKAKVLYKYAMVLDKNVRLCLLNDFYGNLLTKNQQEILDDYLNFDISLTEIAENRNTTRQAVLDTIKKATKKLESFEQKLGMVSKYLEQKKILESHEVDKSLAKKLMKIWK